MALDIGRRRGHRLFMRPWAERCEEAERHVLSGRRVLDRQRALIAEQKARGHVTDEAEVLLRRFEQSQAIFEEDLARIRREKR